MNIIEKAIPHIFRNKYLKGQGGTVILGGSGGGSYSSSTGSGGASQLDDLTDVTVDYLNNEDILQFDEGSGQWKNKALIVDWSRVDNTPTTLEGYGITDAVHKSHLDDNVRHITQAERNKWNSTTSELNDHINDEVRHVTAEDKENWNNPMIKKLKDVKLDEVKDNDILIYRDSDELWHNEPLPEYDWKKILKVNEDGEVVSKFNIVVEGECFIWDEDVDRELTPISDADSYKLISSLGDELRFSCNLYIVRNISHGSSESPIIETEVNNYVGITENGDIIINSLRILEGDLTVVDPAITKEKNDYLKDALYFDSHGCLRCSRPFIGEKTISVSGGSGDTLYARGGGGGGSVVDALDSYDIYSALSANQGRVLNEKVEEVASRPHHTHSNKDALDMITKADVNDWNSSKILESDRIHWNLAYEEFHRHDNLDALSRIHENFSVVDRLDNPAPYKALSANQGMILNNEILTIKRQFSSTNFIIPWYDAGGGLAHNFLNFNNNTAEWGNFGNAIVFIEMPGVISCSFILNRNNSNIFSITELYREVYDSGKSFRLAYKGTNIYLVFDWSTFSEDYPPRDRQWGVYVSCYGFNCYLHEPRTTDGYEEVIPVTSSLNFFPENTTIGQYTKGEIDALFGNYYDKTKIDELIANLNIPDYYNKEEVDSLISSIEIPETDLTNYYNKSEVDGLIDSIPEPDLSNYYNKEEVDSLIMHNNGSGTGDNSLSNAFSFEVTSDSRYKYFKLLSIPKGGSVYLTVQSSGRNNSNAVYTVAISYLEIHGIYINQICGTGSGITGFQYMKNPNDNNVYDIYVHINVIGTITCIVSGYNYTVYSVPSYGDYSSSMIRYELQSETIRINSIKASNYYVNEGSSFINLIDKINSLSERIAALEGGTE